MLHHYHLLVARHHGHGAPSRRPCMISILSRRVLPFFAISAPSTPRVNAFLNGRDFVRAALSRSSVDAETLSKAVGYAVADKRKSVTNVSSVDQSPELESSHGMNGHYGRPAGAESMSASRGTSVSSHDEELAGHLQGLSLAGERPYRATPSPATRGRYNDEERPRTSNIGNGA